MDRVIVTVTYPLPEGSLSPVATQSFGPFDRERAIQLRHDFLRRGCTADVHYLDRVTDMHALLKQFPVVYTPGEASRLVDIASAGPELIDRHDTLLARKAAGK
jgi:hypothetical protein